MDIDESSVVYYCHQCQRNISPNLEDFNCPICRSGFIEEIENPDIINQMQLNDEFTLEELISPRSNRGSNNPGNQTIRIGTTTIRFPLSIHPFQELFSNPLDYVNSQDSFDLILTNMFNQSSGGPPPARNENIEKLDHVPITDEMIRDHENCAICFDEYVKDQEVTKLPCSHLFHRECVVKWLKIHGTCPICRKDLDGRDTSADNRDDDFMNLIDSLATAHRNENNSRGGNGGQTSSGGV